MIGVRGITETEKETVIIVEMGGGMTGTEEGKDTGVRGGAGARSGKAARKEGLGLSSGIERGRRSSDMKREKVVSDGPGVEMYGGIFLLLVMILGSNVWFSSLLL